MGVKVSNNAFGTLSAGISSSDTTVTLDSGQGSRFPTLGAGDYFYATLVDTSNNLEIVKVTARSSDSMTVTRAQDNTTAQAFSIGDRFELRPVAALFEDIITEGSASITNDGYIVHKSSATDPTSPTVGQVFYDTANNLVKHWNGTRWIVMSNTFSASGGTETTITVGSDTYRVHTFTSSGTFTVQSGSKNVEYLIIGGGGGGGGHSANGYYNDGGGGGGAGGYRTNVSSATSGGGASAEASYTALTGAYTVTVGAGGSSVSNSIRSNPGNDSSVFGITSVGGGGGGVGAWNPPVGAIGGSGGSGGGSANGYGVGGSGGAGTSGQGYAGGGLNSSNQTAGGGGGAGALGGTAGANSGAGGNGVSSSINGTATTRAGGGGGGGVNGNGNSGGASGGSGGGGNGADNNTLNAAHGTANTGSGGGGSGGSTSALAKVGANGGSGIVIIRYIED